jgi:protein MpaA
VRFWHLTQTKMIHRYKTQLQPSVHLAEHMAHQYVPVISGVLPVIRENILKVRRAIEYQLHHHIVASVLIVVFAVIGLSAVLLFSQRHLQVSFAQQSSCNSKIVLLPGLQRVTQSGGYKLDFGKKLSVGSLDLLSRQLCLTPDKIQPQNSQHMVRFSFLGNGLVEQTLKVTMPSYPSVSTSTLSRPISAYADIELPLSAQDKMFDYRLEVGESKLDCPTVEQRLKCSITQLGLEQGQEYEAKIIRMYQDQPVQEAFTGKLITAAPVEIIATQPISGAMVHEHVQTIHIETTQMLTTYENITLLRTDVTPQVEVAVQARIEGSRVIVESPETLPRRATYLLRIGSLYAETGGRLNEPLELTFSTSGGPRVAGINIGSYGVDLGRVVSISFDQLLDSTQSLGSLVQVSGPEGVISHQARVQGSRLVISGLPLVGCTTYQIQIADTFQNPSGIGGESAWNYRFRTRCAAITTIGYSVNGRPIVAYRFGSGASKIMFVGGMHGNEKSSYYTLSAWVEELEKHPERIPANRSIIVIPNSNPDGTASGRRTNLHDVDLNRNFPADDWTPGVYMPGPVFAPAGGGSEPLSEPESAALASYIKSTGPRLVLTYHAVASVVIGNGSGDSAALAATYAAQSRYGLAEDSHSDDVFSYVTTGEFEDWLHDKLGIPALLVELGTMSGNEFSRNQSAMWAIAELP